MKDDTPTIEKLKQKVQSSGMKFERGGMNPLLQWSIENIIAPAMFRDKERKERSRKKKGGRNERRKSI